MLELEREFEEAKNKHMLHTCFCYEILNVTDEVASTVDLPYFLAPTRNKILEEAKNRVVKTFNKEYYEKAYEVMSSLC